MASNKIFNINARIKLPENFSGDHEEAIAYLLYEILKQEHLKPRKKKNTKKDSLGWIQEHHDDLWYQLSLVDESYATDYELDRDDEEIEGIVKGNQLLTELD